MVSVAMVLYLSTRILLRKKIFLTFLIPEDISVFIFSELTICVTFQILLLRQTRGPKIESGMRI